MGAGPVTVPIRKWHVQNGICSDAHPPSRTPIVAALWGINSINIKDSAATYLDPGLVSLRPPRLCLLLGRTVRPFPPVMPSPRSRWRNQRAAVLCGSPAASRQLSLPDPPVWFRSDGSSVIRSWAGNRTWVLAATIDSGYLCLHLPGLGDAHSGDDKQRRPCLGTELGRGSMTAQIPEVWTGRCKSQARCGR